MPLPPDLARLGWTPDLARAFEDVADGRLRPGRVSLEHNHVYRVLGGESEWLAEAAGRVKFRARGRRELPVVGDWVAVQPDPSGGRALIRRVLPRRSWFSRRAAGRETREQVIAANIDVVLLVFGLDKPVNPRQIERYLVVASRSGARPVIVLNKSDLAGDLATAVAEARRAARDVAVLPVSAATGAGLPDIERLLGVGTTLALLGPSGVGKSSLVNRVIGEDLLATADVRDWDRRGRHTSVHRQLVVRAAGGLIIDTPGMRELQLWEPDVEGGEVFADLLELAAGCRFRDCRHEAEPDCAVKAAVAAGELDPGRYQSYRKLQDEAAAFDQQRQERGLLEARRETRSLGDTKKPGPKSRRR